MNKKLFLILVAALIAAVSLATVQASPAECKKGVSCTTIQSGELYGSDGFLLTTGYNEWGYNYQAKMFNGMWCDYHPLYRPGGAYYEWCQENYGNVELMMKWNDAWLSNQDCDGDGLLDRHLGFDSYIGSGAWLTNHERGTYEQEGTTCKYEYFVKIVAVPADAKSLGEVWYAADGTEIGTSIWGEFAVTQEVYNDPCGSQHGLLYKSPYRVGLGGW